MEAALAKALFEGHSYHEYRKLVTDLLREGKSSGNEQTEDLLRYTDLNETRMNRLDKTMVVTDESKEAINKLKNRYVWLVIAEGWCGDAAQILPIFNKMAEASEGKIQLKVVFRDQHDNLMKHFLTNNRRAIPKLIVVDWDSAAVKGSWGDRPKGAVQLIEDYKAEHGVLDHEGKAALQMWYLNDKGVSTQQELMSLMMDIDQ